MFLANLHNENWFVTTKKLSRKRHKSYTNNFLSIYQVNDEIIKIEENQDF